MPIYEYECSRCGQVEEVLQSFSDKPLKKCNSCSGRLHKLISQSSFHLKGNGWYVTDYAGKTSPKPQSESPSTDKKAAEKPTSKEKAVHNSE